MKGWAAQWIMELQEGETVQFRPKGSSMEPLIKSGQLVTVVPWEDTWTLTPGVIVLCMVNGAHYLHNVLQIEVRHGKLMFQIGNNKGGINGWITKDKIYGKVTEVED